MRVGVISRDFYHWDIQRAGRFNREVLNRLVQQHPGDQFIFFSDRGQPSEFAGVPNLTNIITGGKTGSAFSWYRWLEWKLPSLLKKYHADVLFSPMGMLSLRSRAKSCLFLEDISFEHFPENLPFRQAHFLKKYVPGYIRKANTVATISDFSKEDIAAGYQISPSKISVVYSGTGALLHPLTWEEREQVKKEFTGGREYLVYTGPIHPRGNLLHLLKAFSILKIRLYPNMQLVLAGRVEKGGEELVASLDSYRFRADVKLVAAVEEKTRAGLIGAAYALVHPPAWESFAVPVLEALRCDVPVIASGIPAVQEAGGEAVLYFDPGRVEDMGDKLCLLYKDEQLRARLIAQAGPQAAKFNWNQTAAGLWACIEKAAEG